MSITIRKFNQFPNAARFWPEATWADAEYNELDQATAESMFKAGAELYCAMPNWNGGDFFRVVFAPMSGETPAISLAAIDFRALELRMRARSIARAGRRLNNFR